MGIISKELIEIINTRAVFKALASIDKNGRPHVVFKGSLHANEEGLLVYYELLESSRSNQNLVHSIWFDKYVAVNVVTQEGESYEILCKPKRSLTSGREFEKAYTDLIEKRPNDDLGAIWILEPYEVTNETYAVRKKEQNDTYPIIDHIDKYIPQ